MNEIAHHRKMPLSWHLNELRQCLTWCVVFYLLAVCVCYSYAHNIYQLLAKPLVDLSTIESEKRLIFTGLTEVFFTYIKIAFFAGFIVSFPFICVQLYRFIAPGLYESERKLLIPYLIASPLLFLLGGLIVYFYIIPLAWAFFLSFETLNPGGAQIMLEARISEYLSLIISLIVGFGLAFQLPVILILLVQLKLIPTQLLIDKRRYAIVIIFIIAAILTPPDVISQIAMAIPMLLLYEISIIICKQISKKQNND
jgi:sec-independent protein translocase protein TatC